MFLRLGRHAFGISLAVVFLAGCGGQATYGPGTQTDLLKTAMPSSHGGRGALLYLQTGEEGNYITMLTYPQGKPFGTITMKGTIWGVCADSKGDVWVDIGSKLFKFAHGGTKAIARLRFPYSGFATSCAVDPSSGDLAVVQLGSTAGSTLETVINVWANAQGEPTVYPVPFEPVACAYDNNGNLFIDGLNTTTGDLALAELPKGGSQFNNITLNSTAQYAGGMLWDGQYLAVNTILPANPKSQRHSILRISVSGSEGQIVGQVPLKGLAETVFFAIQGHTLIAPTKHWGSVAYYRYPEGGTHFKRIPGGVGAFGLALSVAH